jgi:hypothetical protein
VLWQPGASLRRERCNQPVPSLFRRLLHQRRQTSQSEARECGGCACGCCGKGYVKGCVTFLYLRTWFDLEVAHNLFDSCTYSTTAGRFIWRYFHGYMIINYYVAYYRKRALVAFQTRAHLHIFLSHIFATIITRYSTIQALGRCCMHSRSRSFVYHRGDAFSVPGRTLHRMATTYRALVCERTIHIGVSMCFWL